MDETQHFCLRWNNYQSSITSAFENLRDDEDFVDVTLACEGRSIKAHRVVLSACSPYFRDLLKSTPCKHPVILLQDVNFLDLHALVEFIYHGEVNVHQKSLQSFLKTAEVLRVSGLTQQQAEETHSQLAQIQNLANSGARTPLNPHHPSMHDEPQLFGRNTVSPPPPPPQLPLASTHLNSQLFKRSMAAAALLRREHNNATPTVEDNAMKRLRGGVDNGLPASNANSPDHLHPHSISPQLTPADFSTIKHNNNNTPPLKDEKRNGPTTGNCNGNGNGIGNLNGSGNGNGNGHVNGSGNGNGNATGNGNGGTGNGISLAEKLGSLTPSPLARSVEDVKSEPMELVCSNNNQNDRDEHSNDSGGENEPVNRSNSVDGHGKGSLSSVNDEEIENNMPPHPPPPFLMSPAESKLFPQTPFNLNFDPAALAGFNSQLQSAAEMAVSPQGPHNPHIRSAATSPTSSTSSPPSPPTALISPNSSSLGSMACGGNLSGGNIFQLHASSPGPGNCNDNGNGNGNSNSSGSGNGNGSNGIGSSTGNNGNANTANSIVNANVISVGRNGGNDGASPNNTATSPQMPLRMPPPTSGGINEPQECPYCRRTFSCYYSLKRHFQDKHEQSDTLYVCEFCHRRYRTKNSLTTHKSLQHRGSSGMLKRLLKTSAIKNVLVPHPHHHHHHVMTHPRASLFDFSSELGQPPPGIQ